MSLAQFERVLKSAGLRSNDRIWFERWMDGYRRFCRADRSERIPLDRDSLVAFLLEQKARGRKVWQRLQIVKVAECYGDRVRRTADPSLADTQNQALHVLLFFFKEVLKRKLEFINAVRAKKLS